MAVTASESALADGFRPPTITPPARPLGLLRMIRAAFRNPITIWPEEMYDGAVIANQLLGTTRVHVADPSAARRVLLEDAESYVRPRIVKRMLGPALGAGLFTADGEGWRRQRRIAAPSFRIQELRALTPLMSRAGAAAGERLAWRPGAAVDIMPEMIRATFDVIADATIGDDARDVFDRETFARDVDLYLNIFGQVDALDVMRAPSWVPRPWHWRARGATGRIRAAALRVVAARRAAGAAGASLVDRLINAVDPEGGAGLTDREVVDNIVTFFGAGHETTAMALTWTLSILAQQPQLQEALRAETKAVAGDAPITAAHVDALTLHDQVIKEAMRLYPPGAVVGRQVAKPTQLGQHDLKPGDEVLIAVYVMHRSRLLWDRPDIFDPGRFAPGAPAVDRFAYLPFGGGQRICIGMSFALMEATAILAELLRRVRLSPGPDRAIEPLMRVTLRPKGGMPLGVAPV